MDAGTRVEVMRALAAQTPLPSTKRPPDGDHPWLPGHRVVCCQRRDTSVGQGTLQKLPCPTDTHRAAISVRRHRDSTVLVQLRGPLRDGQGSESHGEGCFLSLLPLHRQPLLQLALQCAVGLDALF